MGAIVEVIPEANGNGSVSLLTNTQGVFRGDQLVPGSYTVRVTLAGFLPSLEQHVRISAHLTTIVRIRLESLFASLEELRHQPSVATVESDDWKWVLRSAAATRPVLQWNEPGALTASTDARSARPRMRLEFTDGARKPVSASTLPPVPATAVAYDQGLNGQGRLILAGQMNHTADVAGGGLAAIWLPTGSLAAGPHSALVLREASIGPDGPSFRGVRLDQGGSLAFGQHAYLNYGAEYVLVGLMRSASSVRPHFDFNMRISDEWHAALIFAAGSSIPAPPDSEEREASDVLAAALNQLDSFPALLWRDGRPVLAGGWHEELAAERRLPGRSKLQIAAFHDDNRHVAIFGRGRGLPGRDYFQDYFSNAFAYDGGSSSSWGTRIVLREKLSDEVQVTTVYSFAGALAPADLVDAPLRDMLRTTMRNSLGANVSAGVPQWGTKVTAGYKWVSGESVLSRVDAFGESQYRMDPFLHVSVKQALPNFARGHWEASAACDNLLAQGYVTLSSRAGRAVVVPAFRTFRGGLSLQF